jgi:ABC-type dipeptide/oligopeptide/nickel transport system permease component
MGLAARGITFLVKQLAGRLPVAVRTVGEVASLVATMRSARRNDDPWLARLEKAMELQASLNDKLTTQLEVIQAVLERLQTSLRLLWLAVIATGILAVAAIVLVLART